MEELAGQEVRTRIKCVDSHAIYSPPVCVYFNFNILYILFFIVYFEIVCQVLCDIQNISVPKWLKNFLFRTVRIVSGISLKHFEILHRILKMSILLLINYSHSSYRTNKATVLNLPFNELRKYIGKGGLVSQELLRNWKRVSKKKEEKKKSICDYSDLVAFSFTLFPCFLNLLCTPSVSNS